MTEFKKSAKAVVSAAVLSIAMLGAAITPSLAFGSGDRPAPVDPREWDGPGQSHANDSGISGFDGN